MLYYRTNFNTQHVGWVYTSSFTKYYLLSKSSKKYWYGCQEANYVLASNKLQPIERLHKAMQIQNFKKNLMTKKNPYYKATKEIKKYAGVSENWK